MERPTSQFTSKSMSKKSYLHIYVLSLHAEWDNIQTNRLPDNSIIYIWYMVPF